MNTLRPLMLLDLAVRSLLQDEALAVAAVRFLPKELFPPVFMEAVTGRRTQAVKAMVGAWPFPWLPLGVLLNVWYPHQDILKAALDGLDLLLDPNVRPRTCKLRVLDLRPDIETNFWEVWAGPPILSAEPETTESMNERGKVEDSRLEKHLSAPIQVLTDLCLLEPGKAIFSFFTERINERKGLPRLCCRNLRFRGLLPQKDMIEKILIMVPLDYVQEVSVDCDRDFLDLTWFTPHLGKMVNLKRLHLSGVTINSRFSWKEEEVEKLIDHFFSQVLCLKHLKDIQLTYILSLKGHLPQLFRCMQTPLTTLKITDCFLLESDLSCLPLCSSTQRLECLDLSGVTMRSFRPELLSVLIERTSSTLQQLHLGGCDILDGQLTALVPALGHCSELSVFMLCGNYITVGVLENLVRHTAPLCRYTDVELPFPLDCYVEINRSVHHPFLQQFIQGLHWMLQEIGLHCSLGYGHSKRYLRAGYHAIFLEFDI